MATVTGTRRLLDISGNNISTAVSLEAEGTLLDSNGQSGASNQVLISTATGVDWVDGSGSGIIGGPYLPLSAGSSYPLTGTLHFGDDYNYIEKNASSDMLMVANRHITFSDVVSGVVNERMRIEEGGNVGIGTPSPGQKLDVAGNLRGNNVYINDSVVPSLYMERGDGLPQPVIQLVKSNDNLLIGNTAIDEVIFYDDAGEAMRLDGSGNLGIGTTNPTANLHVQGSSETDVPIIRSGGFGNSGSKLELAETLTAGGDMNYGFSFFNDGNSSNTLQIKAHNNSTTGITAMTIDRGNALTTFGPVPVVGTRTAGDNTTRAASTAFVTAAITAAGESYIDAATFSTSNGIITGTGVGSAGFTVDIDGRYPIGNVALQPFYIDLQQNPVGTTYGDGVSAVPTYYFGQKGGDNDQMKFYAESASSNDITAVWEINDDIETGLTWLFRNKKTYSPYTAIDALKIDGDGDVTVGKDLTITGGDIILSGTGRIQGVDTVSAGTDAANKTYVDTAIAGVPQGDITAVVAGTGLTGGGTSGSVTLNVAGGTYTPYNDIRSLGVPAFTNGTDPNITTTQVMDEIDSDGGFDSYSSVFKTSWSYAGNYNLTDAGDFTETAGSSWITWTDNSSDSTRGNITTLAIAPNTGGSAGGVFIYNNQGSSYSPGWRQVWTSMTDGAGSGLDADLLDGQQGSYYLDYANFTGTPTIPSVGNGQIDGRTSGLGLSGSMDATANQSGNTTFTVTSNAVTAATANTIAYRTSSADIRARLFRSNYANQSTISGGMAFRVNNGADDYIRFCSNAGAIRTFLGVPASGDLNNYLLNTTDTFTGALTIDGELEMANGPNGIIYTTDDILTLSSGGKTSGTNIAIDDGGSVIKLNSDTIAQGEFKVSSLTDGTGDDVFRALVTSSNSSFWLGDIEGLGNGSYIVSDGTTIKLRNNGGINTLVTDNSNNVEIPNGTLIVSGSTTADSLIKDGGTSSQFLKADGSVDSSTYLTTETGARMVQFTRSGINSSTYTMIATVNGNNLASILKMTMTGTSNGVVFASTFDITVNHSQDIHVKSSNGDYTEVTLRITSNNNEDFSIEAKHNGSTSTTAEVCIYPLADEVITPTTTDPGYTGAEYEHTATEGWRYGGEDNNSESSNVIVDGKIGVGTTTPAGLLEVKGPEAYIYISDTTETESGVIFRDVDAGLSQAAAIKYNSSDGKLRFYNNDTAASAVRMTIDTAGNVGIGTTSPGDKLHVNGTVRSQAPATSDWALLGFNSAGTASSGLWFDNGDGELLLRDDSNNLNVRLRSDTSSYINGGNLGIGTTSPAQKLTVNGRFLSQGTSTPIYIKVSSAYKSWVHHIGGGDEYIFAPSTVDGGETWDWANQVRFNTLGVVQANNFVLASDKRLKKNIKDVSNKRIKANWKTFEMIADETKAQRHGVIAQELEKVHPEFVRTDNDGMKSVAYTDLLIAKIAELEARLEKLEK